MGAVYIRVQLPEDIEWHFIGHLQSNKAKTLLAAVPNLAMVQGVDNQKIANHLDHAVLSLGRKPLNVLVQVNTSGEASKSGISPSCCVELAKRVKLCCPNLKLFQLDDYWDARLYLNSRKHQSSNEL